MESRVVTAADGVPLHVDTCGAGPDVVVLSGGPGLVNYLADERLAPDGMRAWFPDPRGVGRSGGGPHPMAQAVADLESVRESVGITTWSVLGHSWGSDLAVRYALDHPGSVTRATHTQNDSLYNTPNTWGIYILNLVCEWMREQGGLEGIHKRNQEKAQKIYDAIDATDFYRGHAAPDARSLMNVTFRLPSEELEKKFTAEATAQGLDGLKGHRSVGGIRASIYNAFPPEGVEALTQFMRDFERANG